MDQRLKEQIYAKRVMIDFDGVIHQYSKGFANGELYDAPVEGAMNALHELYTFGYEIVIFTSRNKTMEKIPEWIEKWTLPGKDFTYRMTNRKEPALIYIDDRGFRFTNWKDVLNLLR